MSAKRRVGPREAKLPTSLRKWLRCKKCTDLAGWRKHVIVGEGSMPARVLFIGEAPGKTEDALGDPFVGKSGTILRTGMRDAARIIGISVPSNYVTNILGCRPTDSWMGDNRSPMPDEIGNCLPRLSKIVSLVRPERVVFLGDVAQREARRLCPDGVKVRHPAFVARRGGIGSVDYRIFVRGLVDVFQSL